MKSSVEKPASGARRARAAAAAAAGRGIVIDGIAIVAAAGRLGRAAASSASTWRRSCWESNGLETMASQPSRSARSRSNGSKVPDSRTTGIRAVAGFALIASQTS